MTSYDYLIGENCLFFILHLNARYKVPFQARNIRARNFELKFCVALSNGVRQLRAKKMKKKT